MSNRRGVLLVITLLLGVILFIVGLAFLGKRAPQYKAAEQASLSVLAHAMAEAGMEDARVKLEKDNRFPPPGVGGQLLYTYSGNIYAADAVTVVGSYTVSIDSTYAKGPYSIRKVSSVGNSGPRSQIVARQRITAELDIAVQDRNTPANPNPTMFHYLNWREEDGF